MHDAAKKEKTIVLLCWMVYFTSYLSRINYGAVISEIVLAEGFSKSAAGIVTTFSFISYGAGQIISGLLGDRMNPKRLIFGGLLATAVFNISMPFCRDIAGMSFVWFLNGFAQSLMWPPLVKIMASNLDAAAFRRTCVTVSIASSVGTIAIYLISPLCIAIYGWELIFFVSAFCAIVVAFIWLGKQNAIGDGEKIEYRESPGEPIGKIIVSSGLILIALGTALQGILKDGISTWMPSLITETYHWDNKAAIFTTIILPIFSIASVKIAARLQRKYFDNELACAAVIYAGAFICCVLLRFCLSGGPFFSILLTALITACMHGVNLMLISIVPLKFRRYNRVSTVTGVMNFFSYVGSALSSYGIAKLSEIFDWSFTILTWAIIALTGMLACLLSVKKWGGFSTYDEE